MFGAAIPGQTITFPREPPPQTEGEAEQAGWRFHWMPSGMQRAGSLPLRRRDETRRDDGRVHQCCRNLKWPSWRGEDPNPDHQFLPTSQGEGGGSLPKAGQSLVCGNTVSQYVPPGAGHSRIQGEIGHKREKMVGFVTLKKPVNTQGWLMDCMVQTPGVGTTPWNTSNYRNMASYWQRLTKWKMANKKLN